LHIFVKLICMNKIFIITFVLLLTGLTNISAQKSEHESFDRKKFTEKRNAFITREVGLTSEEATLFFPLYEEFQLKKYEAGQPCRRFSRELKEKKNVSAEEYSRVLDECVDVKLKEAQIEKKFITRSLKRYFLLKRFIKSIALNISLRENL